MLTKILFVLFQVWCLWVAFGLPMLLWKRWNAARAENVNDRLWLPGSALFYLGILVWSPYVFLVRLAGVPVPVAAVLTIHLVCLYGGLAMRRLARKRAFLRARDPEAVGA